MTKQKLYTLKYPIGEFNLPPSIDSIILDTWINDLEQFPSKIEALTKGLSHEQLDWVYRPGGWNIKQVVHHCADSHINSIIRFKLALTEDMPTIRPYYEDRWAKLIDCNDYNLSDTLSLLKGLHAKLCKLLRDLDVDELSRTFIHPDHGQQVRLDENIGIYAWHSNHHLSHIEQALKHKGQFNI